MIDWGSIVIGIIVGVIISISAFEYSNWRERSSTCKNVKEHEVNEHKKKLIMEFKKWMLGAPVGGGIGGPRSPCLIMKGFIRSDELIEHLKDYPEWNIRKKALALREKYNKQKEKTLKDVEENFINLVETEGISILTYDHKAARIEREFYRPEILGYLLIENVRRGIELVPFKVRRWNGKYCVDMDGEHTIVVESNEKFKAESISRIANQVSKSYFEKVKIIEKDYEESEKLRKSFDDKMLQLTLDVEEGVPLKGECRVCRMIMKDC